MSFPAPVTSAPLFRQNENASSTLSTADLDAYLVLLRDTLNQVITRMPLSTNADGTPLSNTVSTAVQSTVLASLAALSGASLIGTNQPGANVEAALGAINSSLNNLLATLGNPADIIVRGGTVPFIANQSMGGYRLTSLADGVSATDAATVQQISAALAGVSATVNAIRRDGTTAATADIPFGSHKLTGVAAPTADTDAAILGTVKLAAPVGELLMWATNTPPAGFLFCDGAEISRTTYADLFNVIGTTFGAPSSTTFCLPDFRGRMPMGVGTGEQLNASGNGRIDGGVTMTPRNLADFGGEETHLLTTAEIPSHQHAQSGASIPGDGSFSAVTTAGAEAITQSSTAVTGGGGRHSVLSPFTAIQFIIRAMKVA